MASSQATPSLKPSPVWNLPLHQLVNSFMRQRTADLDDVNMIDPFHLQTLARPQSTTTVILRIFQSLKLYVRSAILENHLMLLQRIWASTCDRLKHCRHDAAIEASQQEISVATYQTILDSAMERVSNLLSRRNSLDERLGHYTADRKVITVARDIALATARALELPNR